VKTSLKLAVLLALAAAPAALALPHGGSYPKPPTGGDTAGGAGPSTGGGAGGTNPGPGDTAPPGGTSPAPPASTPTGDTPRPGGPSSPGRPAGAPSSTPAGPSGPAAPPSGTTETGLDWSAWSLWWHYNRHPYLALRRAVRTGAVITGSDEFYLGHGALEASLDSLLPAEETVRQRIVPVLLETLEKERSVDCLSSALVALGRIGESPAPPRLSDVIRPLLSHANQEVAETAAVALGILGGEKDIDLLVALLSGQRVEPLRSLPSERTRAFAAYSLGLVGRSAGGYQRLRVVHSLVQALERDLEQPLAARDVSVACVLALGLIELPFDGERAGPVGSAVQASASRRPLGLVSREDQVRWLLWLFDQPRADVLTRAQVPISLGRLLGGAGDAQREAALTRLCAELRERSLRTELRLGCLIGLGHLANAGPFVRDVEARRTLLEGSQASGDATARSLALVALAEAAGRPGRGADPLAGTEAVRAELVDRLARGRGARRAWAALAAGVLEHALVERRLAPSAQLRSILRAALADARSPDDVAALCIALGMARDVEAEALLLDALERVKDPSARGHAAVALGMVGSRTAIGPIRAIVRGALYQPELLRSASIGLGLIGDKAAVDDLVEMLGRASGLSSQAALASALGFIGDARSVEPLLALARDPSKTDLARAFALVALGRVADRQELPWNACLSSGSLYRGAPATLTAPDAATGVLDIL
jgi:HEAT repeat protein